MFVPTFFSLYLKINMEKTSQKVTKDPTRVEAARKDRKKYMNKLKGSILNDAKKVTEIITMQAMKLPALPTPRPPLLPALLALPPPLLQALPTPSPVILISMALAYLLSLPLAFAYFLHITFLRLQIKNKSMKIKMNHQNDVICFRKYTINEWLKSIEDSIKDGIIITETTTGIFFALKAANVKPPKTSLDAMDIMKLAGGICGVVLVKDYAAYKKWINE